jgi:hypothetical protein
MMRRAAPPLLSLSLSLSLLGFAMGVGVGVAAAILGRLNMNVAGRTRRSSPVGEEEEEGREASLQKNLLVVATRIHSKEAEAPDRAALDETALRLFLQGAVQYGDFVVVAVGGGDDLVFAIRRVVGEFVLSADVSPERIHVVPVTPWGNFTPALNASLSLAASLGAHFILYQSLETVVGPESVAILRDSLGPRDLVVGAALPGHDFRPGLRSVSGLTVPWNTLALWSVPKLCQTGFLAVGEGCIEGVAGGVEEVTAVAVLQLIDRSKNGISWPLHSSCCAKLIRVPKIHWETHWDDEGRRLWHEKKMRSKESRADMQLKVLGICSGIVEHIDAK